MPITGTADRRLGTRAAWTGRSAGWGIYLALCGADALPVAIGRAPGSAPPHRALTAARRERRMRCGVCGVVILCFAMPRILPMQEPRTHVRACACDLSHCVHAPCAVRFTCGPRGKVNASQQHTAPTARRRLPSLPEHRSSQQRGAHAAGRKGNKQGGAVDCFWRRRHGAFGAYGLGVAQLERAAGRRRHAAVVAADTGVAVLVLGMARALATRRHLVDERVLLAVDEDIVEVESVARRGTLDPQLVARG
mmetsp:Transcript_23807/g.76218  ORF Transcript_23807/g.76218 Transcript_23807/m.76218 type:complete len:250 (-) Transcript_23807:234-983(-)